MLTPNSLHMSKETVETIQSWEPPTSTKEVQIFIGFANFYRRFIRNFSGVCKPITDTLRGNPKDFKWSVTC